MEKNQKPEIAYVIQNILPILTSQYDFPYPEDTINTKIDEIPIKVGSSVLKPDIVYFHDGVPVFLVESKKPNKSLIQTIDQALSYIKCYPIDKYSKGKIRPRYFAVTIGTQIHFYAHRFKFENNNFEDWAELLEKGNSFKGLLQEYGLEQIIRKVTFSSKTFRNEILNEIGPIYKFEEKVTPDVIKNTAYQILSFLQFGQDFTSHRPYIDIENKKDRQAQIRLIYSKFDWKSSIGPEIAREFRTYILRSFQGSDFNQYLTEQCVISFMVNLMSKHIKPGKKTLDFECGSCGFLAAIIEKGLKLEHIKGIDIDELPYIIAKTYMALYFSKTGYDEIDRLPIVKGNGLFDQGQDWDFVISNPAGSSKYEHSGLDEIKKSLNLDLKKTGSTNENITEYNLSIQQAIYSVKVMGFICLILPEGFYSNSRDDYLRRLIVNCCRVLAIVSLPRGVFKKGTSTKTQNSGSMQTNMKMSILYMQKVSEINKEIPTNFKERLELNYPVFIANIEDPKDKKGEIEKWLEPRLNVVFEQWQEWEHNNKLKEELSDETKKLLKLEKKKIEILPKIKEILIKLENQSSEKKEIKTTTKVSDYLDDVFKKND